MPALARHDLEALLRARKLDRTLTSTWPDPDPHDERRVAPTGLAALDRRLGGGFPRGQLSELVGPRSSGRTSLLLAALAAATARGEVVAVIDTFDMLDPASAAAAGVDLSRMLWVRGQACASGAHDVTMNVGSRAISTIERAVDRALKAVNLVLHAGVPTAGGFGMVALDLIETPMAVLRRLPFTTWMRLQRVIEGRETVCVVLADAPLARSAGGVTIAVGGRQHAAGRYGRWVGSESMKRFDGLEIEARIVGSRQYPVGSGEAVKCQATTAM
jgi:hypothetical protein